MSSQETVILVVSGAILLVILNILIALSLSKKFELREWVQLIRDKASREYKGYMQKQQRKNLARLKVTSKDYYGIKFSFQEKVDMRLIDKSGIKEHIPIVNFYTLIAVMVGIFVPTYFIVLNSIHSFIGSLLVSCIISFLPVGLLEMGKSYQERLISESIPDFISELKGWVMIKEDLFYAMEKSVGDLPQPLNRYMEDCVTQIKRGVEMDKALDIMAYKVDHQYFYYIILNMKLTLKNRGQLVNLLERLEEEAYDLNDEYKRRKINSYYDRLLTYGLMTSVIGLYYYILVKNRELAIFYTESTIGKSAINLCSLLFFIGFIMSLRLNKFKY